MSPESGTTRSHYLPSITFRRVNSLLIFRGFRLPKTSTLVRQTSKFHCFTAKSTEPSEIFLKRCCACHQFDNSLELISLYCGNPLEIYRTSNYTRSFKASSHVEVLRHAPLLTVASAGLVSDPILVLVLTIVSLGNSHTIHPPLPFLAQARSVLDGTTSPNVGAMDRV